MGLKYFSKISCRSGFTLIEVMIALLVALIVIGAVYSVYLVQQRHFGDQQALQKTRQNLRGALLVIENEVRMIGYDPQDSGRFGLVDVRRYDPVHKDELDIMGPPVLFYTLDSDENGSLDMRKGSRNREHPKLRISDVHQDGRVCLTRDNGAGRWPVAEDVVNIGFAYAFDNDNDGQIDRWSEGGHYIWAVDSDNDNLLDTHLDANDDGRVDPADDTNGDNVIDGDDGGRLDAPVALNRVKAVRVWLMAVTAKPLKGRGGDKVHVVGDRIVQSAHDGKAGMVVETCVMCRNL